MSWPNFRTVKSLKTDAIYRWTSLPIITLWVTQLGQICRLLISFFFYETWLFFQMIMNQFFDSKSYDWVIWIYLCHITFKLESSYSNKYKPWIFRLLAWTINRPLVYWFFSQLFGAKICSLRFPAYLENLQLHT